VRETRQANSDPHLLFSQVGERLGFLSEEIARSAFLTVWAQSNKDEAARIVAPILSKLAPVAT
jgi:hypothetical protein